MDFSILNIFLIAFFLSALYYGYRKGLIASLIYWIGLAATCVLIIRYAPMVKTGIMNKFPIGSFFANSLAYLLIFVMIAILANLISILLNQVANMLSLTFLNRCFGALLGFLNAIIALIIIIAVIEFLPFTKPVQNWMNQSVIIQETQKIKQTIKPNLLKQFNKHKEKIKK